ncbi:hypothetical protein [Nostoc mirabile]|nr:hypothetical protein [Nostoc mirabile]
MSGRLRYRHQAREKRHRPLVSPTTGGYALNMIAQEAIAIA